MATKKVKANEHFKTFESFIEWAVTNDRFTHNTLCWIKECYDKGFLIDVDCDWFEALDGTLDNAVVCFDQRSLEIVLFVEVTPSFIIDATGLKWLAIDEMTPIAEPLQSQIKSFLIQQIEGE